MSYNWPVALFKILKERKICCQMYIGAVGAYSSSQELLKFIRDGLPIKPDIHISYCGANEYENPYFVSTFEQNFYEKSFLKTSKLFPNLVYLLKTKLHLNTNSMLLKPIPNIDAVAQWERNMKTMKALADGNHYLFYGILQPVAGIRNIKKYSQDEGTLYHVGQYKKFYPKALKELDNNNFLLDFTTIFDSIEEPFFDDCHVKEEYQKIVADSIFTILKNKIN